MAKAIVLYERLLRLCRETFSNVETSEYESWKCEVEVNKMFNIKESTDE